MDQTETNLDTAPDTTLQGLQEELQSLRGLITGLLLILIMLSGALDIFLMRQASLAGGQLAEAQKFVDDTPAINAAGREFWNKLVEFSRTHADFEPIIGKYAPFIPPSGPAPAAKPVAPVPAPAAAPQK